MMRNGMVVHLMVMLNEHADVDFDGFILFMLMLLHPVDSLSLILLLFDHGACEPSICCMG